MKRYDLDIIEIIGIKDKLLSLLKELEMPNKS